MRVQVDTHPPTSPRLLSSRADPVPETDDPLPLCYTLDVTGAAERASFPLPGGGATGTRLPRGTETRAVESTGRTGVLSLRCLQARLIDSRRPFWHSDDAGFPAQVPS